MKRLLPLALVLFVGCATAPAVCTSQRDRAAFLRGCTGVGDFTMAFCECEWGRTALTHSCEDLEHGPPMTRAEATSICRTCGGCPEVEVGRSE